MDIVTFYHEMQILLLLNSMCNANFSQKQKKHAHMYTRSVVRTAFERFSQGNNRSGIIVNPSAAVKSISPFGPFLRYTFLVHYIIGTTIHIFYVIFHFGKHDETNIIVVRVKGRCWTEFPHILVSPTHLLRSVSGCAPQHRHNVITASSSWTNKSNTEI